MLKKSSILFNTHAVPSKIYASSQSSRQRKHHFHNTSISSSVTPQGHSKYSHSSNLRWPEVTSANAIPTPYQIFNQRKGSPYSKRRFYELVKLYHPDTQQFHGILHGEELSYAVKLERYRLVVAANDILSDPVKRGAYDIYGAGWNGQPSAHTPNSSDSSWNSSYTGSTGARGWGNDPSGPSNNATWEDWEAWRLRNNSSKPTQEPLYASNSVFIALVILFATIGTFGQYSRADGFSQKLIVKRDAMHSQISQDLVKIKKETRKSLGGRDERIFKFLRERNEGLVGTEEEFKRFWEESRAISDEADPNYTNTKNHESNN